MDLTEFISAVRAPTLFVSHKANSDAHRLTARKKTAETRGWFAVWSKWDENFDYHPRKY